MRERCRGTLMSMMSMSSSSSSAAAAAAAVMVDSVCVHVLYSESWYSDPGQP